MKYVLSPGYTNSEPDHWQTHLENTYLSFERVTHDHWNFVDREQWIRDIDNTLSLIDDEVILIGHSCGSNAIAQWAHTESPHKSKIKAAVLVAPANVDDSHLPPEITAQAPLPYKKLPFPTLVIGSDNDPFTHLEILQGLAKAWDAELVVIPSAGHIASSDGYGVWPEVVHYIEDFTKNLSRKVCIKGSLFH